MRKTVLVTSFCALLFASCETQDKESELVGTWQAVALDAPDVDKAMQDQMNFLDTMGSSTTPEQNMEIYGIADVSSVRDSLKHVLEEYKLVQKDAIEHTAFEFKTDSIFVRTLNGHTDTGKWYINKAGKLVIVDVKEEMKNLKMDMLSLTDTSMRLQMQEDGVSSTVIFSRIDN